MPAMPAAIDVARRFAEAVAALRALHDFDAWIGQYWQERCPVPGHADSRHGAIGDEDVIVWHECEETVFGYLPGRAGCFCIPRDVALPDFPFAAKEPVAAYGKDILIGAAIRVELQAPGN
jgi:hypothetical protein